MSAPDVPTYTSQRWSKTGCTAPGCATEQTATLDGHLGRRCAEHAPAFDPTRAVELMRAGEPGDAMAYLRHFNGEA